MKTTLTFATLGTAALLTLAASQPAVAGMTSGKAVAICKNKVAARFGENAKIKIKRIRGSKTRKVSLYVRGVSEEQFTIECKVDGKQQITLFTDSRDENIAAR
jgi:purine nucleoside permease